MGHALPIQYGLSGFSLSMETVCAFVQDAIAAYCGKGLYVCAISFDGQFSDITTRDLDGRLLNLLYFLWNKTGKRSKRLNVKPNSITCWACTNFLLSVLTMPRSIMTSLMQGELSEWVTKQRQFGCTVLRIYENSLKWGISRNQVHKQQFNTCWIWASIDFTDCLSCRERGLQVAASKCLPMPTQSTVLYEPMNSAHWLGWITQLKYERYVQNTIPKQSFIHIWIDAGVSKIAEETVTWSHQGLENAIHKCGVRSDTFPWSPYWMGKWQSI